MADKRQQLLERARRQGEAVEATRQKMLEQAAARRNTILQLHTEHGMSVRAIAAELEVSAEVVAEAIRKARPQAT